MAAQSNSELIEQLQQRRRTLYSELAELGNATNFSEAGTSIDVNSLRTAKLQEIQQIAKDLQSLGGGAPVTFRNRAI